MGTNKIRAETHFSVNVSTDSIPWFFNSTRFQNYCHISKHISLSSTIFYVIGEWDGSAKIVSNDLIKEFLF